MGARTTRSGGPTDANTTTALGAGPRAARTRTRQGSWAQSRARWGRCRSMMLLHLCSEVEAPSFRVRVQRRRGTLTLLRGFLSAAGRPRSPYQSPC